MSEFIKNCISEIGITLSDKQANKLVTYRDMLIEKNKVMNLTAITDEKEIAIKHFADCIAVCAHIDPNGKNIIDIGTGAGFPGLPIKIAAQSTHITLLDSLAKRVSFLEEVCAALSLEDIQCIHTRAEDGARETELRENFDIAVSRAVAPLNVLCEYAAPFLKTGGLFVALKGQTVTEEIENAQNALSELALKQEEIIPQPLPYTDITHYIAVFKKTAPTSDKYPRTAKKISRSPL